MSAAGIMNVKVHDPAYFADRLKLAACSALCEFKGITVKSSDGVP